jgi:GAF domain-containing protein
MDGSPPLLETDVSDRTSSGTDPDRNSQAAQRAYARSLRLLGELIDGPPPVEELLDHLLAVALAAAPRLTAASVTALDEDGSLMTAASTDEAAAVVDRHEYEAEEGPCFAAIVTGEEILIEDVRTDSRWPGFNAQAAECGFACAGGLPLRTDGETLGALNLFGARPGDLDADTLGTLRRLVPPLSAALHRARAARRYQRLLDDAGRTE